MPSGKKELRQRSRRIRQSKNVGSQSQTPYASGHIFLTDVEKHAMPQGVVFGGHNGQSNPTIRAVVEATWNGGKRNRHMLPDSSSEAQEFLGQAARHPRRSIEVLLLPESGWTFLLGK